MHSYFNPRTHRGVRHCLVKAFSNTSKDFNPRTHRGVRRSEREINYMDIIDFNPRTHRGVRLHPKGYVCHVEKFQSTHPSWGATLCDCRQLCC